MTTLITAQNYVQLPFASLKNPSITRIDEVSPLEARNTHIGRGAPPDQGGTSTKIPSKWLIASPYLEIEHQLDLDTVDIPYQLLAQALTSLEAATPVYATTPYSTCLNWPEVFSNLKSLSAEHEYTWKRTEFYVVEFRSKLKANIDNPLLFKLDKESHREATASGGLLKYWFGSPDSERRNLATCKSQHVLHIYSILTIRPGLWRSKEDAIEGGKGPWHKQARAITAGMYESIDVKGLKLIVEGNVNSWSFEPFGFK